MESDFPLKLGFFAHRALVDTVSGMPEGEFWGFVSSGVAMPKGGACYVARFDAAKPTRARIVAYVDYYGRAYSCNAPINEPPAREADLVLYAASEREEGSCADAGADASAPAVSGRIDVIASDGERTCMADVSIDGFDNVRAARFSYVSVDASFRGDFHARRAMGYVAFMTAAYLAFIEFGHYNDSAEGSRPGGGKAAAEGAFDLSAVYERLARPDFFDSVNREVLEAETQWSENPASACGVERYLVHALRESGVVGVDADDFVIEQAPDGPHARIIRTVRYADMFYLDFYYNTHDACLEDGAFKSCEATRGLRHKLLRAEGALNRFLLISRYLEGRGDEAFAEPESAMSDYNESFCDLICLQAPDPSDPRKAEGRWDVHFSIARAGESWRLPYRVPYEFCLNEACDAVAFNLATPDASVMAQTRWDEEAGDYRAISAENLSKAEARYAAHAAILAAACAFHASARIARVCVNCLRDGSSDDVVLSVAFDRERFCISYAADDEHAFESPFEMLASFDARFDSDDEGRMQPVELLFELGKGEFHANFERVVALDQAPLNEEAHTLLRIDCPRQLSIFEDALRCKYADEVSSALDGGVDCAVTCLKSIHDRSEDLLVRDICSRLTAAFVDGSLNETSFLEVKEAFVDAYGLKPLAMRASALMRDDDPSAVGLLEELAARGDALEGFEDTSRQCFRYFDSYETRAIYALRCDDDAQGRVVSPLPDEAYLAHDSLAQELTTSIVGADEALAHAKRCIELAPSRAYSYLRAARAYFMKDDFANEAAMCCKALEMSWNGNDAGLALYWLAFSFWKLEKYDAAVVCYRRCVNFAGNMAIEAKGELEELLGSVKGLKRHTTEQEDEILRQEGVPVGALRENAEFLLAAGAACIDSSAVSLGCVLTASSARVMRDDAIIPVLRALNVAVG